MARDHRGRFIRHNPAVMSGEAFREGTGWGFGGVIGVTAAFAAIALVGGAVMGAVGKRRDGDGYNPACPGCGARGWRSNGGNW